MASASVAPKLYCDCTLALRRSDGVVVPVRSRRWDCPSCGRDKAEKLREMVIVAGVERLFVLTFSQPRAFEVEPARHAFCDAVTHVYLYKDGTWRWRMLETCPHCCRFSSAALKLWREALRRRWPSLEMLWVREVKPSSGAFDVNVVVKGLPVMTRHSDAGRFVKAWWAEAGGGFMDLGDRYVGPVSPGALGRYVGKYLTKLAHRRMAPHFRRWGRSAGFAPEVTMGALVYEGPKLNVSYWFEGWVNVLDGSVSMIRYALQALAP